MKAIVIDKFVKVSTLKFSLKVQFIDQFQDYDEIKVSEVPQPRPREGEVLVKIAAAGVNFVDLLYVSHVMQHDEILQFLNLFAALKSYRLLLNKTRSMTPLK